MYTYKRVYNFIILLILVYFFSLSLYYNYLVISFPFQLEYREGASLLLSNAFIQGIHPYSLKNMPYLIDMYGFIYPLLSTVFIKVFGLNLSSLRILSMFSIVIVTYFFFYLNKSKTKSNFFPIFLFTVSFYILNLFAVIPTARSDAFGFMLFIFSVYIPFKSLFNKKSLLISLILTILAFYTKSYFLVGFPFVMIYLFFFQSIKRSVKYSMLFFVTLIVSLLLIHLIFDFYFVSIFGATLFSTTNIASHLINQLLFYFISILWPLTFIFLLIILHRLIKFRAPILFFVESLPVSAIDLFNFKFNDAPFLKRSVTPNYHLFIFLLGLLLIVFKLGGHTGQFGVYLIHFLSFPLLSYLFFYYEKHYQYFQISLTVLGFVFLINCFNTIPLKYVDKHKMELFKVQNLIKNNNEILSTPLFASILIQHNKPVYLSGLTENAFYIEGFKNNSSLPTIIARLKDKILLKKINQSLIQNQKYISNIDRKIKNKEFDLIFTDTSLYDNWAIKSSLLNQNYRKTDSVDVFLFSTFHTNKVYIYKPITRL